VDEFELRAEPDLRVKGRKKERKIERTIQKGK